jgi:hypothetical protein
MKVFLHLFFVIVLLKHENFIASFNYSFIQNLNLTD